MTESIVASVVLLLAVYGCVQMVRFVALRLYRPPKERRGVWLWPLSGHCEDVEYLVRSLSARRAWESELCGEICLVDTGADEETRELAARACGEVAGVRFVERDEIPQILSGREK